jgi:hypothetical protein
MRILFGKIILALLVGTLLLGPISLASVRAKERMLADPVFRLPEGTRTLIVGDSHLEKGLNPEDLPGSASIAYSGETYFYTYFKLRHFLRFNPAIRTVILGCGWHNFPGEFNESRLFGDRAADYQAYFPLLDVEGTRVLRRWSPDYLVPLLLFDFGLPIGIYKYDNKALLKGILRHPLSMTDIPFYGGHKGSQVAGPINRKRLMEHYAFTSSTLELEISSITVVYFRKIIELCRKENIRVLLVTTPVHKGYRDGVPIKAISYFNGIIAEMTMLHGIQYIDLSTFPLPNSSFRDADHLNRRGASAVGKIVGTLLTPIQERACITRGSSGF